MGNYLRIHLFRPIANCIRRAPSLPIQTNREETKYSRTVDIEKGAICRGRNEENKTSRQSQTNYSYAELQRKLHENETELAKLRRDNSQLLTRLSEMGAIQLIDGNPNITDLSDQNRPDKLAEQFSELYDNQWTDCYQVLIDDHAKQEEESISILLRILIISYDICLDRIQSTTKAARDILLAFTGKTDGETNKALDSLILETLHKFKTFRTITLSAVPANVEAAIKAELVATIGGQEIESSSCYIQECMRICWLMCIKDPPLHIFYEKEQVFDKDHFMEYTEKGPRVSYVVWPALYLYKDGPMMRKGVAQGTGKRRKRKKSGNIPNSGVNVSSDVFCEEEANPGETNQEMMQIDIHQMNQYSLSVMNELGNMCKDDALVSLSDIKVHVNESKDNTHGDSQVKYDDDELRYETETKHNVADKTGKIYHQEEAGTKVIASVGIAEGSTLKNSQGSTDLQLPYTTDFKHNGEWIGASPGETKGIDRKNWSGIKVQNVIINEIQTDCEKLGKEKFQQTQDQGQLEDIKKANDADDSGSTEKLEHMKLDETRSWKETDEVFSDEERDIQNLVFLKGDREELTKHTEESLSISNQTLAAVSLPSQVNALKGNNSGTFKQMEENIQKIEPENNSVVAEQLLDDFEITGDGKGQKLGQELKSNEGDHERDEDKKGDGKGQKTGKELEGEEGTHKRDEDKKGDRKSQKMGKELEGKEGTHKRDEDKKGDRKGQKMGNELEGTEGTHKRDKETRGDGKGQKVGKELEGNHQRNEECVHNNAREQPEENCVIYGPLSRKGEQLSSSIGTTCSYPPLSEDWLIMRSLERNRKYDVNNGLICGEEMNMNQRGLDPLFEPDKDGKEEKEVLSSYDQHENIPCDFPINDE